MTTRKIYIAGIVIAAIILWLFLPHKSAGSETASGPDSCAVPVPIARAASTTYAQEVWISALEWCESRGKPGAINKIDRDGTASYYSFQFKPGTFRIYGEKYGVIDAGLSPSEILAIMKDSDLQRAIVRGMINDASVNWLQQFPDCVSKKVGMPPRY